MGQLHDHEKWCEQLPRDIVEALEEWARGTGISLHMRGWFNEGRSGEPVARTVREHDAGGADQRVLKFFKPGGEPRVANIQQAVLDADHTYRDRIAHVEPDVLQLRAWKAVFLRIAQGRLVQMKPLNALFDEDEFPDYCSTVVRSVLQDWNQNRVSRRTESVAQVLTEIMGRRRSEVLSWGRRSGLLDAPRSLALKGWKDKLTNPFLLVTGAEQDQTVEDLLTGKAHGDLSGRNVLIPVIPEAISPEAYVLIDCDRYSDQAPLARDPMHLLVALILDKFDSFGDRQSDVAKVLVDPNAPRTPRSLEPVRALSAAIHQARSLQIGESWGSEWDRQCLLSLVGVGLVHLGRDLRTNNPEHAKEWCFYLAALAADAYLRTHSARSQATPAAIPTVIGRDHLPPLVDRHGERRKLWTRLASGSGGVVMLRGTRGVGKTALVKDVLSGLSTETAEWAPSRVHALELNPVASLDVNVLADYVAGANDEPARRWFPGSSLVRLESELKRLGHSPVVVSIDSAENLLDTETELVDPDIDEALDMLATERDHRVTVLLVTRRTLYSPADRVWQTQHVEVLDNLSDVRFSEYLESLDGQGSMGLGELSDESRRELHDKLQGNPRLAELAHAAILAPNSDLDLRTLVHRLRDQEHEYVPALLTQLVVAGASEVQRRILEALAAFDTPVPKTAVMGLLDDVTPAAINAALSALTTSRVVYHVPSGQQEQYYVPSDDARLILSDMPATARSRLYYLAADELTALQNKNPRHHADLRVHFAELTALLRAGEEPAAYNMIELIDDVLQEWNSSRLLLTARQAVCARLEDDHLEMANWNAIGSIYSSSCRLREFELASEAFGKALALANKLHDQIAKLRIHGNMAAMYWERNDTQNALNYFGFARDEALRLHDPMVRMGALEGVADCNRRHGDYANAIRHAEEAFVVPDLANYPDTPGAQNFATSRKVAVALKLARWFAELGHVPDAARYLALAEETAVARPDEWLRASVLDGSADLEFARGAIDRAKELAVAAEAKALQLRDPITLLQARTTLCLVHLRNDDVRSARLAIERAFYHRREGRSLVVLALHALVARQRRDRSTAKDRFSQLHSEASDRVRHDERDFSAWDFRGIALCGMTMDTGDSLDEAVASFRKARSLTPRTPGLVDRLRLIVDKIDETGRTPNQLSAVAAILAP